MPLIESHRFSGPPVTPRAVDQNAHVMAIFDKCEHARCARPRYEHFDDIRHSAEDFSVYALVEALDMRLRVLWQMLRKYERLAVEDGRAENLRETDRALARDVRQELKGLFSIRRAGLGRAS